MYGIYLLLVATRYLEQKLRNIAFAAAHPLSAFEVITSPKKIGAYWNSLQRKDGWVTLEDGTVLAETDFIDQPGIAYEQFVLRPYHKNFPVGDVGTVLDIGANMGYFSIVASKNRGSRVPTIIAAEPNPSCFEVLTKTLRANHLQNVTALNVAVTDREGRIKFRTWLHHSGIGTITRDRFQGLESLEAEVEVNSTTLDKIISQNGLRKVDFVKIDAEGAEDRILAGAEDALEGGVIQRFAIATEHGEAKMEKCLEILKRHRYGTLVRRVRGSPIVFAQL